MDKYSRKELHIFINVPASKSEMEPTITLHAPPPVPKPTTFAKATKIVTTTKLTLDPPKMSSKIRRLLRLKRFSKNWVSEKKNQSCSTTENHNHLGIHKFTLEKSNNISVVQPKPALIKRKTKTSQRLHVNTPSLFDYQNLPSKYRSRNDLFTACGIHSKSFSSKTFLHKGRNSSDVRWKNAGFPSLKNARHHHRPLLNTKEKPVRTTMKKHNNSYENSECGTSRPNISFDDLKFPCILSKKYPQTFIVPQGSDIQRKSPPSGFLIKAFETSVKKLAKLSYTKN